MKTIYVSLENIHYIDEISVCLGFFDALHIGHQSLIKKAKTLDNKVALLSMEPGPKAFFSKEKYYFVNDVSDKEVILEKMGVDYLIICRTSKEFYNLTPEEFIEKVIIPLGCKNVICGFDFTFGRKALGNKDTLLEISNNRYNVYVCDPVIDELGEKISSTLVKRLIEEGNVEKANKYLPRPFQIKGKVTEGYKNGRTIGFATANIDNLDDYIYPKDGVYAGITLIDNKLYPSMINVGKHPTVDELNKRIIEVHIINENINLYNKTLVVKFIKYLRGEIKFESLEQLKNQLEIDKKLIIDLLENNL